MLAWAALIVISVPLAATFAALGARHPDGGGVATYARLAFGTRVSTMVGWAFFLAIPIGAPVAAGFGASYVAEAAGGGRTTEVGVTAGIIVVVAIMNWLGIKISAGVQLGIAAVIATLLLVAILVSLPRVDTDNLTPFLTHGWSGVGSAAALLVWAFAGWEIVSSLSAEYRHPERDIARATAITLGVVTVLYLGIAFVTVAVLGSGAGRAPLADLLAGAFGDWARPLTTVIAVLLTIGAINSYFAGASRLGASLAITGAMPRWLGSDIGDGRATRGTRCWSSPGSAWLSLSVERCSASRPTPRCSSRPGRSRSSTWSAPRPPYGCCPGAGPAPPPSCRSSPPSGWSSSPARRC